MAHTKIILFTTGFKNHWDIILIMLFCPIMFINGACTINSGEMSSGLGIISEHIQYASYAGAIGMVVFAPFMQRVLAVRRPKDVRQAHSVYFGSAIFVQLQTVGYYSCYAVSLRVLSAWLSL